MLVVVAVVVVVVDDDVAVVPPPPVTLAVDAEDVLGTSERVRFIETLHP
jgi:hypothetical protein